MQYAKYFHWVCVRFCHLYVRFSQLLRVYPHCRLGIQSPPQAETSSRKRPRHFSRSSWLKRGITRRLPFSKVPTFFQTSSAEKSLASVPIRSIENLTDKVLRLDKQNGCPLRDGGSWSTSSLQSWTILLVICLLCKNFRNSVDSCFLLQRSCLFFVVYLLINSGMTWLFPYLTSTYLFYYVSSYFLPRINGISCKSSCS